MPKFRLPWLFILPAAAVMLGGASPAAAEDFSRTFSIEAPASWVQQETKGSLTPPTKGRDGSSINLLVDYQENVATSELYIHWVNQPLTQDGVEQDSSVTASYDPAYQTLAFHHITVTRDGVTSSRLARDAVSLLRRETSLEWSMLDGTVTASIVLKDIRPGDIVDCAYTVRGRNPAFNGKFVNSFPRGSSSAVGQERIRVLSPSARPLQYRAFGTTDAPLIAKTGSTTEYLWQWNDLAPIASEDATPSWYVSRPWIELSEFTDWSSMVRWAIDLYPPAGLPAELEALCAKWTRASDPPEARLQSALDFVQQQIRYLGVELGTGSYTPRSPETVSAQRFGDCKDKAYLLCTLLRRMGIAASPVLVDTRGQSLTGSRLPSPLDFNHVIVAVTISGTRHFVDPTDAYQRGPVLDRFVPNYGYGLIVAAGQDNLTRFPSHQGIPPDVQIVDKFIVHAQNDPASLVVETTARGSSAEDTRAQFAAHPAAVIAKSYLDYYAALYPGIKPEGVLEVHDDEGKNIFSTVEHYSIPGFWTLQDDKKTYAIEFFAKTIYDRVPMPRTKIRSTPIEVTFPAEYRERFEVTLPEPWPVTAENSTITTAAFALTSTRSKENNRVVIDYHYKSLANQVATADVPDYNKAVLNIDQKLGYRLTWRPGEVSATPDSPVDSSAMMIMILSVLLFGGVGFALYRVAVRPAAAGVPVETSLLQPSGLGGWLILVGIGILATPIVVATTMQRVWSLFSVANWHDLTAPTGARYSPGMQVYLIYVICFNAALVAGSVLLTFLFFQRRRSFPRVYIWFLVFSTVTSVASNILNSSLGVQGADKAGSAVVQSIIQACIQLGIWIPYMLKSGRVKNTFVR
jgi:transglutaminase-like putative cysteine protease